ncbi:iron complex transport system substrate-binding protein [Sporosarcina luteola]|nr:iron complex transport system substrate-binding protein [Sporosarcina luteola]
MNKRIWLNGLLSLLVVFMLGACGNDKKNEGAEIEKTDTPKEEVASYTVTDDLGKEITFEKTPETIVSLQPSNTEILFALGVGDQIIGATDYDTYPKEALDIERVSDSVKFNGERIIELNPDVVIAYSTGGEVEGLATLEEAGIPVFVIQSASSFDDVYGDIAQIADVLNLQEKGDSLIEDIQSKISSVTEKLGDLDNLKQMYFEISPAPDIYTAGKGTFQQEIFNQANVTNVFGDLDGWPKVSEEDILTKQPDVIVTTVSYIPDPVGEIKGREGWDMLQAVKEDHVIQLDSDIMSRPGPRIGEAVELLAKAIYPEKFE